VARRAAREAKREAFFLDPARPLSDLVGALAPRPELHSVVAAATGASADHPLAVTALERFAQCAFKGYANVVLSARTDEEQHELPDAREEGNLGHDALAAAFLASREVWAQRPRDAEAIVARGLSAADVVLAAAAGHAPLRAVVRLRVRESVRAVLRRAIDDTDWDFAFAEQAFGKGKSWPAFEVHGESAEHLWLRGSVDRIDRAHVGAAARVIDYKRSKNTVKSASASLGETALQVPIYAAVAARELHASATGLYLPVQPRDLAQETRSRTNPEARVAELARPSPRGGASEIERRALDLVAAARSARFAPLPAKESECTYCELSGGCRKPRFAMLPVEDVEESESP
jgi:ATP-dependent helicase/DNAse subunit B